MSHAMLFTFRCDLQIRTRLDQNSWQNIQVHEEEARMGSGYFGKYSQGVRDENITCSSQTGIQQLGLRSGHICQAQF